MFFENPYIDVKILSVLHLNWKNSHSYASGRDFCALSYRCSGGADFTHGKITKHIAAKDIIYIPSGFDYHISSREEELFVIHFIINGSPQQDMDVFTSSNSSYFEQIFKEMYKVWSQKKTGYYYNCKASFNKILEHIAIQKSLPRTDLSVSLINDAAEYIHEHYSDKRLTVASLAKKANMSDTYFRKLFVAQFSQTPLKYINALRVNRAVELLASGYYSVSETAEKCGFDTPNYFSTVFKKTTGKSPVHYRNAD